MDHPKTSSLVRGSDDYRIPVCCPELAQQVDCFYDEIKARVSLPCGAKARIYGDYCHGIPLVAVYIEMGDKYRFFKLNERLSMASNPDDWNRAVEVLVEAFSAEGCKRGGK
jgi:hypothetical protein